MNYFVGQLRRLMLASGGVKRNTLMALDLLVAAGAAVMAFWLRLGTLEISAYPLFIFLGIATAAWLVSARLFGIYSQIVRYAGIQAVTEIVAAAFVHGVVIIVIVLAFAIPGIPRTVPIIHVILFTGAVISCRAVMRVIISDLQPGRLRRNRQRAIVIYGAGKAGQELAFSMRSHPEMRLVGFVDDDPHTHGRRVDGVRVSDPTGLAAMVGTNAVDEVILALPNVNRAHRAQIVSALERQSVRVRTVPDMTSVLSGQLTVKDVQDVKVEDLLGREPVAPNAHLLAASITGKTVMITGAGGSIGSELARQAMKLQPRRLILLDISEPALFTIEQEFVARAATASDGERQEWQAELCDCSDAESIHRVIERHRPDTIFHAAAYKHVPLLEANPLSAARNNIIGTLSTAKAADACGVERFVLVSTDKAVRPTNIMGTTKRICEMTLQALADEGSRTIFTMVRFGNVLGSSGSVVPHFRSQIERGGPVTITHRSITRYFMTIPEAAQLVIQAGAMARSGQVFLLEMGEPIQIATLAETMVRLSGLTVRTAKNPDGDIEIIETGLRPGEKLFEELLIDSAAHPTAHPRIYAGEEEKLPWSVLDPMLGRLQSSLRKGDIAAVVSIIVEMVPAYKPSDAFRMLRETALATARDKQ